MMERDLLWHPQWIYGVGVPTSCRPLFLSSSLLGGFTAIDDLKLFLLGLLLSSSDVFLFAVAFQSVLPKYCLLVINLLSAFPFTSNFVCTSNCVSSFRKCLFKFRETIAVRSLVVLFLGSLCSSAHFFVREQCTSQFLPEGFALQWWGSICCWVEHAFWNIWLNQESCACL